MGVIGGGSRHIVYVADYWCASNKVHFLISKSGYKVAEEHIQKNPNPNKEIILYTTPFDDSKNMYLVYLFRIIKSILEIRKLKEKYDVVIAPNYLPQNMIPSLFLKRDAKLVVHFRNTPPSLRKEYLERMNFLRRVISIMNWKFCVFLAKSFDLIFVVNRATREYFIEKGFAPEKVVVVNNGIPYKEIEDVEVENKEYEGVFLGRLVWNKGIYDLVDIWKFVVERRPSTKLCIIGDGSEREKLEKKIKEEGLEGNITLVGGAEGERKYGLMKKSKLFIYPSYYESWCVVIAEAMACGLPVIAYDLPIYAEIHNNYVFTVKIGDVEEIAKKVIDFLEREQDYREIIQKASIFVSKYNWEEVAKHQLLCIKKSLYGYRKEPAKSLQRIVR